VPEPVVRDEGVPLSVVIPCLNEGGRLISTIDTVARHLDESDLKNAEIIVVDDGSTDETARLVEQALGRWPGLRLLRNASNEGKGSAVRRGVLAARGQLVLMTDADLSTPISELGALTAALEAGSDIAIASRHIPGARILLPQGWRRRMAGWVFRRAVRAVLLPGLSDTQCGFKLFRRRSVVGVFEELRTKGLAFDVELLRRARKKRLRIVEVPVAWRHSLPSSVNFRSALDMLFSLVSIGLRT